MPIDNGDFFETPRPTLDQIFFRSTADYFDRASELASEIEANIGLRNSAPASADPDPNISRCSYCARAVSIFLCNACRRCAHCGCGCKTCNSCRARAVGYRPYFCARCGLCSRCDKCRKIPHYTTPARLGVPPGPTPHLLNKLPRLLGVELELSDWKNLQTFRATKYSYSSAHDWSVQPSGLEMVLRPLAGDRFISGIAELAEHLFRAESEVNETCAYHVHVDGVDLSVWEIRRLLTVYRALEPQIYSYLIAPWRSSSPTVTHYCQMLTRPHRRCERCDRYDQQYPNERHRRPSINTTLENMYAAKTTSDLKAELIWFLYGIDIRGKDLKSDLDDLDDILRQRGMTLQDRKGGRYEWCRYVGLNLHAWMYRGTVEWRMKEGVTDFESLLLWPLFCGWFTHAVTAMNDTDALAVTDLVTFARAHMPAWVAKWVENKCSTTPASE